MPRVFFGKRLKKNNFRLNSLILCGNFHKGSKLGRNMKNFAVVIPLTLFFFLMTINMVYAQTYNGEQIDSRIELELKNSEKDPNKAIALIISNTKWEGIIQDSQSDHLSKKGNGIQSFSFDCVRDGKWEAKFQKQSIKGELRVGIIQDGTLYEIKTTNDEFGEVSLGANCYHKFLGACLIATATYGSELSPQVQQLRELRDRQLLQTHSGMAFMTAFNDIYYSFSPIVADYEREHLYFKNAVKLIITPMISSLSILNYVDMDSEVGVLGYGISLILLNIGMYLGIPLVVLVGIKRCF